MAAVFRTYRHNPLPPLKRRIGQGTGHRQTNWAGISFTAIDSSPLSGAFIYRADWPAAGETGFITMKRRVERISRGLGREKKRREIVREDPAIINEALGGRPLPIQKAGGSGGNRPRFDKKR